MALFAAGQNLPGDYGIGIDERCVEIPWLFAKLRNISGGILDAGSALNYAYLIDRLLRDDRKLDIMTLAPEKPSFTHRGVGYLYEDLRNIPIVDEHYDCVACISTLEHIGFNNEAFTKRPAEAEHRPTDYLRACAEMLRVLRRGGRLLLTVPFGKYSGRWSIPTIQRKGDRPSGRLHEGRENRYRLFQAAPNGSVGCRDGRGMRAV